jgi:hypothetical protein
MEDWLRTFQPSTVNTAQKQFRPSGEIKTDDIPMKGKAPKYNSFEPDHTAPDNLGYVNLKITGLRRRTGRSGGTNEEVVLPNVPWRTSLVQLNRMVQDLG